MAKAGVIAPLAKQALKDGVSLDDLVKAHPELDEKALRRGFAQVKSKAGKSKPAGKKKASKKAAKKAPVVAQARPKSSPPPAPVAVAGKPSSDPEIRRFVLQHGTKAVKAVIAELES